MAMVMNTRRWLLGAGVAIGAVALSGCSRLGLLNGLNDVTPGDGGTAREAMGIAFGRYWCSFTAEAGTAGGGRIMPLPGGRLRRRAL
jgi:hypothetical protein